MSRAAAYALVARNAQACEEAKGPVCRCPCGGAFHGVAHSVEWVAQQTARVDREWEEKKNSNGAWLVKKKRREVVTPGGLLRRPGYTTQPDMTTAGENAAGDVRNALALLVSAAVREGGSVRYEEADVAAILRRLRAAVSKLEGGV